MPSVFNESGITTKTIDEFRGDMVDSAKVAFSDKLDGRELRADDSSVLGRIFAIVAKSLAQNEEVLPLILQSTDINSAEGQQLDNLLWNIHRIKRKPESQSTGMVILYGDIGTYVAIGSEVANSITGDTYRLDDETTFSTNSVNGVDLEPTDLSGLLVINYSIEGLLSQSPPINIQLRDFDDTDRKVADRIVDAVNSQSSYLIAKRNSDNSVKVIIEDESKVGSFSVRGNLTIPRSYSPVYATSKTYDSQESTVGQIDTIRTATLGWRGVSNPYYVFPSEGIEDDEEYRHRGKLKQQNNSGKYTAILMALKSVSGVVYENVQQNTSSNTTNSGIINNGIAVTVMGGNEDAIALSIFHSISEGIMTSGDIVKLVKDINGFEHEVRFSRPKIVPLEVSMSLITYPNFPINGNVRIRQAIVEWFNELNVGEDIHYSRLYEPINSIQGFAVKNLKFGYKGGTLSLEDIIIRHDEIATLSAEDIIIGGAKGSKNIVEDSPSGGEIVIPTVCTPTDMEIPFDESTAPPLQGFVTGMYRINGGDWVNYGDSINSRQSLGDTCRKFLYSIKTPDGGYAISTTGSGGGSSPFFAYRGQGFLVGASNGSVLSQYQTGIVKDEPTTIEFQVVEEGLHDLVYTIFGESLTIKSCAYGSWVGL